MSELFDRQAVLDLLGELGRRLEDRGQVAEIYVVGGTAMILAYDRERLTRDIDAVWSDDVPLRGLADDIADERGLPRGWLNDRVKPMLPRMLDDDQAEALVFQGLTVAVASPHHMVAMKARAARDARDLDDLMLLCRKLGVTSLDEVLAISDQVWGPGMLREETLFVLREGMTARGLT